jgi:hypothetical protein
MATLTVGVGAGFDYSTLSAAIAASQDGDVIQVQAGTYTNDFSIITTSITIEGVGGLVDLVATEPPPTDKGILVIGTGSSSPHVTLDNLEFSGAAISDADGADAAGVRYQSGNLTINNSYFESNQDGLLATPEVNGTGTITINNSEFADNGVSDPSSSGYGLTHNLYVGDIAQLTIESSYFYDPIVGNNIQSRAAATTVENSRIEDRNGTGSYEINLPNGGNDIIENNVIEKGSGAQNPNFIAFGEAATVYANSSLTVTGNTILNDYGAGANFVWNDTSTPVSVTGNTTYGLTTDQLVNGPVATPETNTFQPQSNEPALNTSAAYLPVLPFTFACFASGTRILTSAGEVAVETLRTGQQVIDVHSGEPVPRRVKWIGRRSLDLAAHPTPELACPVRIRRDTFADGVPRRDLFLSPDHAIFVDCVLIPARLLVNGATIAQDLCKRRIRYHHVELDAHGVMVADGLPSESYLDTGNRGIFENADAPRILHPGFDDEQPRRVAGSCRPFADDAARVEPVWRRLAVRATKLGYRLPAQVATTDDPGLRVVMGGVGGGRAIKPVSIDAGRYTFVLPVLDGPARLVSRVATPCEMRPWVEDRRRLGVMVSRLTLRRGAEIEPIPLDHPHLSHGWWAVERDRATLWRWTDGDAAIDLSGAGPAVLELSVLEIVLAGSLDYPIGRDLEADVAYLVGPAPTRSVAA